MEDVVGIARHAQQLRHAASPEIRRPRFVPQLPVLDVNGMTVLAVSGNGCDKILPILVASGTVRIQIAGRIALAWTITAALIVGLAGGKARNATEGEEGIVDVVRFQCSQPFVDLSPVVLVFLCIDLGPACS